MKKCVLKNLANFTGKYMHWSLLLIKWQHLWPANLLKETATQVFSCEHSESFNNAYFEIQTNLFMLFHE